jgi:hypothetical protein
MSQLKVCIRDFTNYEIISYINLTLKSVFNETCLYTLGKQRNKLIDSG